jgi:hypothetical protein
MDMTSYPSLADHYIFGISKPISFGFKRFSNSIFNTRLFLKLMAAGNVDVSCDLIDDAMDIQYFTAPIEHLVLYDKASLNNSPCQRASIDMVVSKIQSAMRILNGRMPCHKGNTVSDQYNSLDCDQMAAYSWCEGGPLETNVTDCSMAVNSLISPIQYLYMYQLLYHFNKAK